MPAAIAGGRRFVDGLGDGSAETYLLPHASDEGGGGLRFADEATTALGIGGAAVQSTLMATGRLRGRARGPDSENVPEGDRAVIYGGGSLALGSGQMMDPLQGPRAR